MNIQLNDFEQIVLSIVSPIGKYFPDYMSKYIYLVLITILCAISIFGMAFILYEIVTKFENTRDTYYKLCKQDIYYEYSTEQVQRDILFYTSKIVIGHCVIILSVLLSIGIYSSYFKVINYKDTIRSTVKVEDTYKIEPFEDYNGNLVYYELSNNDTIKYKVVSDTGYYHMMELEYEGIEHIKYRDNKHKEPSLSIKLMSKEYKYNNRYTDNVNATLRLMFNANYNDYYEHKYDYNSFEFNVPLTY